MSKGSPCLALLRCSFPLVLPQAKGGLGLLREASSMRIVHGNTLTAAAVLETSKALFHERPVFVTGASSPWGFSLPREVNA